MVTTAGLVMTLTTGFLGMNVIDAGQSPWIEKWTLFAAVLIPSLLATGFAVAKSKPLADFLEALSDDQLSTAEKLSPLRGIWRKRRPTRIP